METGKKTEREEEEKEEDVEDGDEEQEDTGEEEGDWTSLPVTNAPSLEWPSTCLTSLFVTSV
eukprot:9480888-Pyramimonas_sp.AAC.1